MLPDENHPAGHEFLVFGLVLIVVGFFLIHCYFDRSGRDRPFALHFFPGL